MNTLNLKNINLHSPYMVGQTDENDSSFYFTTDFGLAGSILMSIATGTSFVRQRANLTA